MEKLILSFVMAAVVVLDADNKLLKVFEAMCTTLKLNFGPLACKNHKGISFEGYHILFNKTQTIVSQYQGKLQSFLENNTTSQYAWNSAPIYDTDIPRCVSAVGRNFKFPTDVYFSGLPQLKYTSNSALYQYLRNFSNDSHFSTSVLQILVE